MIVKGDIFKDCMMELPQYNQFQIMLIDVAVVQLKDHTTLLISIDNLAEAAGLMAGVSGVGIRLDYG